MKAGINQALVFLSMIFVGSPTAVLMNQGEWKIAISLLIGWAMLLWVAVPGMHPEGGA